MEQLPQLGDKASNSLAMIKRKGSERKTILIGITLCVLIFLLIFLIGKETTSISANIEGAKITLYSPVDGRIVELPFTEGIKVQKGDALLRFDPAHIRKQNAIIREYLIFFQQNRHNTGTLKQKFRPLFSEIFDELATQRKIFLKKEKDAVELYKAASFAHSKLQVQMRNPSNRNEQGLPKKEWVEKEKQASLDIVKIGEHLENASLERAAIDRQIRDITNDLNQPYGILYRYLEEQHKEVQKLVFHEYLYAGTDAKIRKIFVKVGDYVKKETPLYEILPEGSGQWWVNAIFTPEDAEKLKEREICTIISEDGLEFEGRIVSITPKENETEVRLFIQNAPEGLVASEFATVIKK